MASFLRTFRPKTIWEILPPALIGLWVYDTGETFCAGIRKMLPSYENRIKFGLVPDPATLKDGDEPEEKEEPAKKMMQKTKSAGGAIWGNRTGKGA
jgi:hypothetical protein